jgi:type III secretion system FlhB-like substrate exporter
LRWKVIILKTLVEMLQLWQIGSEIGPSQYRVLWKVFSTFMLWVFN